MQTTDQLDRDDALESVTQRLATGPGKLYVTISIDEDGDPVEVFLNIGRSGGYTNAWAEALGKTLSNALRSGTDPSELADDLVGIRTDSKQTDNGDRIHSIPDAVGVALSRHLEDAYGESIKGDDSE